MVGSANDQAERAADRVADQAMRTIGSPGGEAHARPGADPLGGLPVDSQIEQRINRARGGGAPLDDRTRTSMESALGSDLSGVRVHTGGEADVLNRSLQAKAFTTGSDVFFSQGAYRPGSASGSHLLAHELAHVVQQGGSVQRATDSVVRRAFDPGNPNVTSVTGATKLTGGLANKGVYLLVGEGGKEVVAKFIDEDPRRAQMADEVLDMGGLNSSGAKPYGMDVGRQITAKLRELAQQARAGAPGRSIPRRWRSRART